ncbi:hypothetical protein C8J57DRAFT_1498977 [Mycena rebaudengoi]|nr:hypothetical protein C8J57DRAFT_1498977 [Mycena rebaudengoi]
MPLLVKFIIVGGSVAGLATGYALSTAGHQVVIVEKSDGNMKVKVSLRVKCRPNTEFVFKSEGSIRCPPNMTRILSRWPGMLDLLQTRASKCAGISFRRGATSEPVGYMKFHDQIMQELEADFLILQHDDLVSHLKFLCATAGVVFEYGSKVTNVRLAEGATTVVLEDGRTLLGDIVIGADGHNSLVRSIVAEEDLEPEYIVPGANVSISTKVMQEHDDLASLCDYDQFTIWMGKGSSVTGIFDRAAETLNLGICGPVLPVNFVDHDWHENCSVVELLPFDLSDYDPRLQKLINLGYACHPTVQHVLKLEDDVVGLDGTAVLAGDAAHCVLMHGSHNSAMAIEDAVTLGELFSHLEHRKQIPVLLDTYGVIRQQRVNRTVDSEYQSLLQICLPDGLWQEARDFAMRQTLDEDFEDFENCSGSDMLVKAWEEYLILFSHDAKEEVDDWWSQWGRLVKKIPESSQLSS